MPVELRVIEEELDALLAAFVGQRLQHVLVVRRALDDVVVAHLGIPHREAVVMLAGDRDVLHARGLHHATHSAALNFVGLKWGGKFLVLGNGDLLVVHHPLAVTEHAVDAPMDEQAETRLLEPGAGGQVARRRCVALLGGGCLGCSPNGQCDDPENPRSNHDPSRRVGCERIIPAERQQRNRSMTPDAELRTRVPDGFRARARRRARASGGSPQSAADPSWRSLAGAAAQPRRRRRRRRGRSPDSAREEPRSA